MSAVTKHRSRRAHVLPSRKQVGELGSTDLPLPSTCLLPDSPERRLGQSCSLGRRQRRERRRTQSDGFGALVWSQHQCKPRSLCFFSFPSAPVSSRMAKRPPLTLHSDLRPLGMREWTPHRWHNSVTLTLYQTQGVCFDLRMRTTLEGEMHFPSASGLNKQTSSLRETPSSCPCVNQRSKLHSPGS